MAVLYDRDQIESVLQRLESGEALTLEHIGDCFGKEFYLMLLFMCMDAKDASRAIDGAMRALQYEAAMAREKAALAPEPSLIVEG